MKINEFMCQDVCFVKPNCNVYDAARIMNENHIGCIPVCDDEKKILGIVTDRDIVLRNVACNKDAKITPVSDIMTTNIYTCKSDDSVENAEFTMSKNQIRRIPVVDNQNRVVGIVSIGDLAHNTENNNLSKTMENICECKGNIKNNY